MKIYLSGGMHSGWQDLFISRYPDFTFFDPRSHGLTEPEDYTKWDIEKILESDLVIAYLEDSNPSGLGMAFEIGVAVGAGKPIYFVNEQMDNKYTKILECASLNSWIDIVDCLVQVNMLYRLAS